MVLSQVTGNQRQRLQRNLLHIANFFNPYIIAAFKQILPVDCIVAGLSSLLVVFFVTGLLV